MKISTGSKVIPKRIAGAAVSLLRGSNSVVMAGQFVGVGIDTYQSFGGEPEGAYELMSTARAI